MLALACAPGSVAYDGGETHVSHFTQALIEQLGSPEDVSLTSGYITHAVNEATGGRQTPWVNANICRKPGDLVQLVPRYGGGGGAAAGGGGGVAAGGGGVGLVAAGGGVVAAGGGAASSSTAAASHPTVSSSAVPPLVSIHITK